LNHNNLLSSKQILTPGKFPIKPTLSTNKSVPHLEDYRQISSPQEINITHRKRRHTENLAHVEADRNDSKTLSFKEFRVLLSSTNSSPIDWEFEWKEEVKDVTVLETEYHIIRQILMIMNRQLDDMAIAFMNLRKYSSLNIINFLSNQRETRTQEDLFNTDRQLDTATELSDQDHKLLFSVSNNKSDLADKLEHNGGRVFKTLDQDIRNDFTKNPLNKPARLSSDKVIDRDMISTFLDKANIQYLPDDINYIFKAFGTNNDYLTNDDLELAINCSIWNV
jgi:hypothetical protein